MISTEFLNIDKIAQWLFGVPKNNQLLILTQEIRGGRQKITTAATSNNNNQCFPLGFFPAPTQKFRKGSWVYGAIQCWLSSQAAN